MQNLIRAQTQFDWIIELTRGGFSFFASRHCVSPPFPPPPPPSDLNAQLNSHFPEESAFNNSEDENEDVAEALGEVAVRGIRCRPSLSLLSSSLTK
ncbi:hypothetical protein EGR_02283 [Echinococcus granulosus]|uniref:Uncharacterized protein n=1 Tax=Echinococcus granulosus TaxID=6210 RepID=W6UWI6_ECHGR|nr:hypothetical protein EGR_02283 [Echinococcus granulosus]EUB62842.1 hypothetical protein EGR_02283 [Echinococcus granulosus]